MKKQLLFVIFCFCVLVGKAQDNDIISLNNDTEIEAALDQLEIWLHENKTEEFWSIYPAVENKVYTGNNLEYKARLDAYFSMYKCFLYDYDKMIFYIDRALEVFESTNNKQYLAYSYNIKSLYYNYKFEDLEKAILYANKAISYCDSPDLEIQLLDLYFNLTYYYYKEELWELSYSTAIKSIALSNKYNKEELLYIPSFCKGFSALKLNKQDEAYAYFEKNNELVELIESNKNLSSIYLYGLSEYYKVKGDVKRSLEYLNKYNKRLLKSNKKNLVKLADKIKQNNELLAREEKNKAQAKLNEAELKQDKIIIMFSIFIIIGLLFFLYQQYKLKKINLIKNVELSSKNSELEAAKHDLEKAIQIKVDFLNSISHELKTPLYAINSITQLIKQNEENKIDSTHIDILSFSGEHLLRFINDVIESNVNGEENKMKLIENEFNLRELLKNIKQTIHTSMVVNNKNSYEFLLDDALPEKIVGDTLKLSRIIINLLNNASKNTKDGTISLQIKQKSKSSLNTEVEFSVSDTGRGISEHQLKEIKKAFKKNQNLVNRVDGFSSGLGMGLVMVNRMLKLYHSELKIDSKINLGSTFKFTINFPIASSGIDEKINTLSKDNVFSEGKVLIVDDNKINQMITKRIVYSQGVNCEIVSDGYSAIERLIEGNVYKYILMDIMMPELNGYETTKIIKEKFPYQKIIALTAITGNENNNKFIEAGFDDVIYKPFKFDEFFRITKKYA